MGHTYKQKGFTLIELLVVIAIIAILAVVVILTLNPAELLKQARDSNRISDAATIKSALAIYQADVAAGSQSLGTTANCYMSATATSCAFPGTGSAFTPNATTSRLTDGTNGWMKVNFSLISSGAPFSQLPSDPTNSSPYVYRFAVSGTGSSATWKFMAICESSKQTNTSTGACATDNSGAGSSSTAYEVGTDMAL